MDANVHEILCEINNFIEDLKKVLPSQRERIATAVMAAVADTNVKLSADLAVQLADALIDRLKI